MKITKKTRGFVKGLSNKDYHDDRLFRSSSVLKTALKDPKKFHDVYVLGKEGPAMPQAALDFGNYVHTAILEPHLLEEEYIIYPGGRKAGKVWEQFKYLHRDKTILSNNQYMKAQDLIDSFLQTEFEQSDSEHLVFGDALFKGGVAEESLFTELGGMPIKVRFDYRISPEDGTKGIIKDIKTTSSYANSAKDAKDICESFGYLTSAALYVDAVEKETGIKHDFHLVFMSKADLKCNLYKVSEKSLERGRQQYKEAIKTILEWEKTGKYITGKIREV